MSYISFVLSCCIFGPWRLRGENFDSIFVFQISPLTSAIPAILLKWIRKKPVTIWVLDLWPDMLRALSVIKNPILYKFAEKCVSKVYHNTDLLLTQSKSFLKPIKRLTKRDIPIEYFPQWAEESKALTDCTAPELRDYKDRFVVLFAGNIGECQDFPSVLAAAEEVKDTSEIVWVIVGDGRKAPWVQKEIIKRNLQDTVTMIGRVPSVRMPEFYASASALLVSLKSDEVFSMTIPAKVQSYLNASRPIVGMLDGEGARVIEEAGAGVVCRSGDYSSLAENVRKLSIMPKANLKKMGINGRDYACKNFSKDQLIDTMIRRIPYSI